jgi:hypothetical protein
MGHIMKSSFIKSVYSTKMDKEITPILQGCQDIVCMRYVLY